MYVGLQKKKRGGKKCLEICAIEGGGGRRLMAKTILNFHFDYLTPSLRQASVVSAWTRLIPFNPLVVAHIQGESNNDF